MRTEKEIIKDWNKINQIIMHETVRSLVYKYTGRIIN